MESKIPLPLSFLSKVTQAIFPVISWENYFHGARSELDFADRKRGSKSYYYIMYKERNGQLLRVSSCHLYFYRYVLYIPIVKRSKRLQMHSL